MKRISFGFLYPLSALVLLILVLSRQIFIVPPLGKLLDPFRGAVQNEKSARKNLELDLGSKKPVNIFFDARAVPHVFARDQSDLFFAQGYVTAADRLWQMDFLSYISAGRLSELFSENVVSYDRSQRRMGILMAAKRSLQMMEADPETKQALDNYTRGVNTYIAQVSDSDLPLEYKLIDYRPEPWTNLKSVLIVKYMGALLSGYEEDLQASYLLAALGKKEFDKLFSNYFIRGNTRHFAVDRVSDSLAPASHINYQFLESSPQVANSTFNPRLGSNSWAIGPGKSASGAAILCNDPHLNLSFPAVWYELQLHSGEMNVYGYSIPGTPGVIIGYNQHIAWGLTNGSVDVRELFKLELKEDCSQYKYDGAWKNTTQTIEEIKVRNSKTVYDTVFYTVHGPISADFRFGPKEKAGFASRWTLHDPSNELLTFIKLNKATNYAQFKEAIRHYQCPVQNFSYADVEGNIATHLQGKIPKNREQGRGRFILDGSRSDQLTKEVLTSELPFICNPAQGFVCSANNNPFHLEDPFYVNGHYSELRSDKIKQLLSRPGKLTKEDMQQMQMNSTNRLAELAVPVLLSFIPENDSRELKKLKEWDCAFTKQTETAILFTRWWALIRTNTWDELRKFPKVMRQPDDLVLLDLLSNDPRNKYFDKLSTDKIETAADIVQESFDELVQNHLKLVLKWENYNQVDLVHLASLPAFSKQNLPSSGHPDAINALSGSWGPSVRFVVEMTGRPQGYGVYAGGQSGSPASLQYDSFINDWSDGKYYKLDLFLDQKEAGSKTGYKWTIN